MRATLTLGLVILAISPPSQAFTTTTTPSSSRGSSLVLNVNMAADFLVQGFEKNEPPSMEGATASSSGASKLSRPMRKALEPLEAIMGGSGAMYMMAKLPATAQDDQAVARGLVRDHGVAVIPGSFCGFPGWIRVCYANLPPEKCLEAAERLGNGIRALL